jgi:hypothetical protein
MKAITTTSTTVKPLDLDLDALAAVTGGQHTDPFPSGPTPSIKDTLKPTFPNPRNPYPGNLI